MHQNNVWADYTNIPPLEDGLTSVTEYHCLPLPFTKRESSDQITEYGAVPTVEGQMPVLQLGDGDSIVLLMHDICGISEDLLKLAKRISEEEFRVVIPLTFQHHLSLFPEKLDGLKLPKWKYFRSNNMGAIADRVDSLVTHLGEQGARIVVMGNCMSGNLAIRLLKNEYVVSAVCCQPALPLILTLRPRKLAINPKILEEIKERMDNEPEVELLGFRFLFDWRSPSKKMEQICQEFEFGFRPYMFCEEKHQKNLPSYAFGINYRKSRGHSTLPVFLDDKCPEAWNTLRDFLNLKLKTKAPDEGELEYNQLPKLENYNKPNQFYPSKNNNREIVVLIHGLGRISNDVIRVIHDILPEADIWRPWMPYGGKFSRKKPEDVVKNLADDLDEIWKTKKYNSIRIVGYSMGTVFARALIVFAKDRSKEGENGWWSPESLKRLVLLAGIDRGWDYNFRSSKRLAIQYWIGVRFSEAIGALFDTQFTAMHTRKGAKWLTETRLKWLKHADSEPVTVQLLGTIDDVVSPNDSVDFSAGKNFSYFDVSRSGHYNITNMKTPNGETEAYLSSIPTIDVKKHRGYWFKEALLAKPAENPESPTPGTLDYLSNQRPFGPERFNDHDENKDVKLVAFVIHGIRDEGHWTNRIARRIQALYKKQNPDCKVKCVTASYGYFGMGPFLLPRVRKKKMDWFVEEYLQARAKWPDAEFVFVGHSNGTYLLAKTLELYGKLIRFDRVFFANSVVRSNYPWHDMIEKDAVKKVLNFPGTEDWVVGSFPAIFEDFAMQDLGSAGYNGFKLPLPKFELAPLESAKEGNAQVLYDFQGNDLTIEIRNQKGDTIAKSSKSEASRQDLVQWEKLEGILNSPNSDPLTEKKKTEVVNQVYHLCKKDKSAYDIASQEVFAIGSHGAGKKEELWEAIAEFSVNGTLSGEIATISGDSPSLGARKKGLGFWITGGRLFVWWLIVFLVLIFPILILGFAESIFESVESVIGAISSWKYFNILKYAGGFVGVLAVGLPLKRILEAQKAWKYKFGPIKLVLGVVAASVPFVLTFFAAKCLSDHCSFSLPTLSALAPGLIVAGWTALLLWVLRRV